MPHIHTRFGEHDLTCSMYIVNISNPDKPLALLHTHRTLGLVMQAGGHVELTETPWESVAHELREETGYRLSQLDVLQPKQLLRDTALTEHPVPLLFNSGPFFGLEGHYHTNLTYGFVTDELPAQSVAAGESDTLRWYTRDELGLLGDAAFPGVVKVYTQLLDGWQGFDRFPAAAYAGGQPDA